MSEMECDAQPWHAIDAYSILPEQVAECSGDQPPLDVLDSLYRAPPRCGLIGCYSPEYGQGAGYVVAMRDGSLTMQSGADVDLDLHCAPSFSPLVAVRLVVREDGSALPDGAVVTTRHVGGGVSTRESVFRRSPRDACIWYPSTVLAQGRPGVALHQLELIPGATQLIQTVKEHGLVDPAAYERNSMTVTLPGQPGTMLECTLFFLGVVRIAHGMACFLLV